MRNENIDKGEKAKTIIGQIGQTKESEKNLFQNGTENVSEEDFMEIALSESEAEDSYPRFDCMSLSKEEVGEEDIADSDKLRYIKAVEILPGVKYKRRKRKKGKSEIICSMGMDAYVSAKNSDTYGNENEETDVDDIEIEDEQMNDFFFDICKSNGKRFNGYSSSRTENTENKEEVKERRTTDGSSHFGDIFGINGINEDKKELSQNQDKSFSVFKGEELFYILSLKSRGLLYSHTYPYSNTLWVFPTKLGISYCKERQFENKGEKDYHIKIKEGYEVFQNEEKNAILNVLMKYLKSKGYEVQPGKHRVMCYKMFGRYQINYGAPHYFANRKFLEKLSKETKNIIYLAFTLEDKAFVQGRVANWIYQNFGGLEYFFEEGYGYAVCTINDILEAYDFPRQFTSTMNLYDIMQGK